MVDDAGQAGGKLSPFLEQQRIGQVLRFIPPQTSILDIGCGRAKILEFLPSVSSYVGIDLLDNVLASNRLRYPQYRFFHCNIEQDPLPVNDKFSIVTMMAILEHLSHPQQTLSRVLACLASDGKIILTTPHPFAKGIHRLGASIGIFSRDAAEEHTMFFDRRLLSKLAGDVHARLILYRRFQAGLNQLAILSR